MESDSKKAAEVRKAKSNASIKLPMHCPECRHEYNRRNIVKDPVVRTLAQLCAQLQMQPDLRELRSADDSIFDCSQASPLSSPISTRLLPSPAPIPAPIPTTERPTPTARRKLQTALAAPAPLPSPAAAATSPASKRPTPPLTPPRIPSDPFEFTGTDLPPQVTSFKKTKQPASISPAQIAAAPSAAAAVAAVSDPVDDSSSLLPSRSGRLPPRKAALVRRSYKEAETQMDTLTQEDSDIEPPDTDHAPSAAAATSPPKGRRLEDLEDEGSTPLITLSRGPPTSIPSPPQSSYKMKKTYPVVPIPEDGCAVCGLVLDEETVVQCRECKVKVHSEVCYGPTTHTLSEAERANWYCDRCSPTMGTKEVTCCVCPNTDDQAFKKTDKGHWIHASCAMWLSAPRYRDPSTRNLVCDVNKIPRDSFHVPCKFCTGKGAILQCSYGHGGPDKCVFGYHVPCGVRFGIEFELRAPDPSSQDDDCDDVFFHSFCKKHQPLKHLVPACNSKLAVSAKKPKKKRGKRGRKSTAAVPDEDSDAEPHDVKRPRLSDKPVNRSINLADTSMDTASEGGSVAETPLKPSDALFRSLFNAPSPSPFQTPTQITPIAAAAAASTTTSPDNSAVRKLAFTPPACHTASVGVALRNSPAKTSAVLRSASVGSSSTTSTPATSSRAPLPRTSSLRRTATPTPPPAAAAAAANSSHATRTSTATAAAAAPIPLTPSGRAPLRSMARDEVHSRDLHARNSAPSPLLAPKSRAGRHRMVLLGTKLDAEQQELMVELVGVLNANEKEDGKGKSSHASGGGGGEKLVTIAKEFDSSVTHVITTTSEAEGFILKQGRTIKYFQGLLAGAWVLGVDWVSASLCARKPMPETDFLVRGDAKVANGEETHGARRARNREKLFAGMHFVWSGAASKSGTKDDVKSDVLRLIELGGGVVAQALPGVSTKRAKQQPAHDSDMDEGESQVEMELDEYPVVPSTEVSPVKAPRPTATGQAASGRWCLLVDDTSVKRGKPGSSRLKTLKAFVPPADWLHCVQHGIEIVGVNWLFDSISAFRLLPTERATK